MARSKYLYLLPIYYLDLCWPYHCCYDDQE